MHRVNAGDTSRILIRNVDELEQLAYPVGALSLIQSRNELWNRIDEVAKEHTISLPLVVATKKLLGSGCPICQLTHRLVTEANWEDTKSRLMNTAKTTALYVADAKKYYVKEMFPLKDEPEDDVPPEVKRLAYFNPNFDPDLIQKMTLGRPD